MADCVLVPIQSVGVLALTREEFDTALAVGARLVATPSAAATVESPDALLDADQAATQLGVSSRWLEGSARAGIVPHYKLGRFIRFRVSEVAKHFRVVGAPLSAEDGARAGVTHGRY
jgi:Helix-turn-helix domain